MRVLFINTVFEKGSTGRIVKDLGTAIEERGGEYRAIYGRGNSDDPHAINFQVNLVSLFMRYVPEFLIDQGFIHHIVQIV